MLGTAFFETPFESMYKESSWTSSQFYTWERHNLPHLFSFYCLYLVKILSLFHSFINCNICHILNQNNWSGGKRQTKVQIVSTLNLLFLNTNAISTCYWNWYIYIYMYIYFFWSIFCITIHNYFTILQLL